MHGHPLSCRTFFAGNMGTTLFVRFMLENRLQYMNTAPRTASIHLKKNETKASQGQGQAHKRCSTQAFIQLFNTKVPTMSKLLCVLGTDEYFFKKRTISFLSSLLTFTPYTFLLFTLTLHYFISSVCICWSLPQPPKPLTHWAVHTNSDISSYGSYPLHQNNSPNSSIKPSIPSQHPMPTLPQLLLLHLSSKAWPYGRKSHTEADYTNINWGPNTIWHSH